MKLSMIVAMTLAAISTQAGTFESSSGKEMLAQAQMQRTPVPAPIPKPTEPAQPGLPVPASLVSMAGVYLGLTPSDGSPIGLGEIEIKITADKVKSRVATGSRIQAEELDTAAFMAMTRDQLLAEFKPGSNARAFGFLTPGGLKFIFLENKPGEFDLVMKGMLSDFLGPTMLTGPAQVKRGEFEQAVAKIEAQVGKDKLPRLKFGGKPKP